MVMSTASRSPAAKPRVVEHAVEQAAVIDADDAVRAAPARRPLRAWPTSSSALGRDARLADDVDVALHELPVAALLRALGAPDRRHLDRPEHRRQLGAVAGVEAGERHGQVEAQPEVDQVERLGGRLQVVVGEPALQHPEGELLVVAAETRRAGGRCPP